MQQLSENYGNHRASGWSIRQQGNGWSGADFYLGAPGKQYGRDIWCRPRRRCRPGLPLARRSIPPTRSLLELKSLFTNAGKGRAPDPFRPKGSPIIPTWCASRKARPITTIMLDADIGRRFASPANCRKKPPAPSRFASWPGCFRNQGRAVVALEFDQTTFCCSDRRRHSTASINSCWPPTGWLTTLSANKPCAAGWKRGGNLWCRRPGARRAVPALLGDVLRMQVVERVSLTSVQLVSRFRKCHRGPEAEAREFEQPVPLCKCWRLTSRSITPSMAGRSAFVTQVGAAAYFVDAGARPLDTGSTADEPRSRNAGVSRLAPWRCCRSVSGRGIQAASERPLLVDED